MSKILRTIGTIASVVATVAGVAAQLGVPGAGPVAIVASVPSDPKAIGLKVFEHDPTERPSAWSQIVRLGRYGLMGRTQRRDYVLRIQGLSRRVLAICRHLFKLGTVASSPHRDHEGGRPRE